MSARSSDYDAIVIGSGMGALAFAACMARVARWRVLLLERHFKLGGFTHTFRRPGGWEWDVGLHYVGAMEPGAPGRRLFDFISDGGVKWNPMPEVYDRFLYPGFRFDVPKGEAQFREALQRAFPGEREAIVRYFRDLRTAERWFQRHLMARSMPRPLAAAAGCMARLTSRLPLTTTGAYLNQRFRDPAVRAVVASQWGDFGLPPAQSAFAIHALVARHYMEGGWYPEGGAGSIPEAIGRVIREAGGDLLPNHRVTRILLRDGRAIGVEVHRDIGKQGDVTQILAPVVVSDAGARITYNELLPPDIPLPFRSELQHWPAGFSSVGLYLGLRGDPRLQGFRGENYWMFDSLDHDATFARRDELLAGKAHACYLSFPSLKDPKASRHTAEILASVSYDALADHAGEPWRRRSDEYQQLKDGITEALLGFVEQHLPGFRQMVEYAELSTPVTVEHFTGAAGGAIYGYPATPERYRKTWLGVSTPVRNLYLTGADAVSPGIVGAMMGGVATAARLLGPLGFFRIMRAAGRATGPAVADETHPTIVKDAES